MPGVAGMLAGSRQHGAPGMNEFSFGRRSLLVTGLAAMAALPACDEPRGKGARRTNGAAAVGVLYGGPPLSAAEQMKFERDVRAGMGVAAPPVQFQYRYSNLDDVQLPALAAELVALGALALLCLDVVSARAAAAVQGHPPILFHVSNDPVREGLVASISRPGAAMSGIVGYRDLNAKLIELCIDAWPEAQRIGFLWDAKDAPDALAEVTDFAAGKRREIVGVDAGAPEDIEATLAAVRDARLGALVVPVAVGTWLRQEAVLTWTQRRRVKTVFERASWANGGGLIGFGVDARRLDFQLGDYLGRVLSGADAGDLPVRYPDRYELVVNLATARRVRVSVPLHILRRADRIVE